MASEQIAIKRALNKVGGSASRSVVIPKHVLDAWTARFGREIEEVDIYVDGDVIKIVPRGIRVG